MSQGIEEKYIIQGFDNDTGCIAEFMPRITTISKDMEIIPICKVGVLNYCGILNSKDMEKVALILGVIALLSGTAMIYFSDRYNKLKAEYEFLRKGLAKINKERMVYQLRKNESDCTELFWRLKYHGAIDSLLDVIFKR